jgi:hypothetical protein
MCMPMGGGGGQAYSAPPVPPPPDPKTAVGQLAIFKDQQARSDYRTAGEAGANRLSDIQARLKPVKPASAAASAASDSSYASGLQIRT